MQLNHSIHISYNYLDVKHKKIGRYLAHFPGSFAKNDAIDFLCEIFNTTQTKEELVGFYLDALAELVTRSLLEHDLLTDRFHFHRLIKEFFIFHSSESEEHNFKLLFQLQFGIRLCERNERYLQSPKKVLKVWMLSDTIFSIFYQLTKYNVPSARLTHVNIQTVHSLA